MALSFHASWHCLCTYLRKSIITCARGTQKRSSFLCQREDNLVSRIRFGRFAGWKNRNEQVTHTKGEIQTISVERLSTLRSFGMNSLGPGRCSSGMSFGFNDCDNCQIRINRISSAIPPLPRTLHRSVQHDMESHI